MAFGPPITRSKLSRWLSLPTRLASPRLSLGCAYSRRAAMSLFGRKKKSSASLAVGSSSKRDSLSSLPQSPTDKRHVDDFGRPVVNNPAYRGGSLHPDQHFGAGYGVGTDEPSDEMALLYGYTPTEPLLELSISRVEDVVRRCAQQLKARGQSRRGERRGGVEWRGGTGDRDIISPHPLTKSLGLDCSARQSSSTIVHESRHHHRGHKPHPRVPLRPAPVGLR